ncbi:MAG: thioredoxin family protein [Fimbriimonadaceae bacterium]|nr:thioredoxin family protein [Fimbriimonadaceae bacterium]
MAPLIGLAGLLLLGSCASQLPQPPVEIRSSYDRARQEAIDTGRPLLVMFSAPWCGACKVLKEEGLGNNRVREALNKGAVVTEINIDLGANASVKRRFYNEDGIPYLLLMDPKKESRLADMTGYESPGHLLEWFQAGAGKMASAPKS